MGLRIISFQHEARIEATTGLQMSQPFPLPWAVMTSANVFSEFILIRWNSAWRECGKCSHRLLFTLKPRFFISASRICFASGPQPPQLVAAFVAFLRDPKEVQPLATAAQIAPFDTLLHEQISAESGRRSTPSPRPEELLIGKISSSGCSGSGTGLSTIWSSVP